MSRLGKLPIKVPAGVEIKTDGKAIHVKGPKGTLSFPLTEGITVKVADGLAVIEKDEKIDLPKPTHGLYRAKLNCMIEGVSKGFEIKLEWSASDTALPFKDTTSTCKSAFLIRHK